MTIVSSSRTSKIDLRPANSMRSIAWTARAARPTEAGMIQSSFFSRQERQRHEMQHNTRCVTLHQKLRESTAPKKSRSR